MKTLHQMFVEKLRAGDYAAKQHIAFVKDKEIIAVYRIPDQSSAGERIECGKYLDYDYYIMCGGSRSVGAKILNGFVPLKTFIQKIRYLFNPTVRRWGGYWIWVDMDTMQYK